MNVTRAESRANWADKARKIEDLGYSTLNVPDHLTETFAPMPQLARMIDPDPGSEYGGV